MVLLPHTLCGHSHVQIRNQTIVVAILANLTDPVLVWNPLIQHGVTTNCQERFHGSLHGANFLAKYNQVADPLLQYVSIGDIDPNCKKGVGYLIVLAKLSYCWRQLPSWKRCSVELLSSRTDFKFLRAKKEAQEAFDDVKIN